MIPVSEYKINSNQTLKKSYKTVFFNVFLLKKMWVFTQSNHPYFN